MTQIIHDDKAPRCISEKLVNFPDMIYHRQNYSKHIHWLHFSTPMEQFITLECPSCGGKTQFSPQNETFVCQYCGNEHIFNLPTRDRRRAETAEQKPRPLALLAQPREVQVQKKGQTLSLSWRWFRWPIVFLIFFCIAWDSFLCFWYATALSTHMGAMGWFMVIFPIAHVAVGVGLTYYTLASLFNRTTVRLDRETFSVQHDPVPWPGEVKVAVGELEQLYCKEKVNRSSDGDSRSYKLCAVLKNGRQIDLVSNLESPDIASFLEQQIENWLGITNQPVVGEMGN
jgi:predicted RNA-binding Zn-ribbon protein involved in translation (DUF1610 family)